MSAPRPPVSAPTRSQRSPTVVFARSSVEIGAEPPRQIEPVGGRADRDDGSCAREPGQRDGAQADGAHSLHDDTLAQRNRGALDDVDGSDETTATADVVLGCDRVGEASRDDAGLEVDGFGPAAEQAVGETVGDAIDTP